MPDRQHRLAWPLCARLAHHFDTRRVRLCRRKRKAAWPECGADPARAWNCRQPVRRTGGEHTKCCEERQRRQCGSQWAVCRASGGTGLHGRASRNRGRTRAATATIRTLDGRTLEATVLHARGSTEQPLSDQDIEAKVRELARHGAFSGRIDDVIAAAWELDKLGMIHPLIEAARPG